MGSREDRDALRRRLRDKVRTARHGSTLGGRADQPDFRDPTSALLSLGVDNAHVLKCASNIVAVAKQAAASPAAKSSVGNTVKQHNPCKQPLPPDDQEEAPPPPPLN